MKSAPAFLLLLLLSVSPSSSRDLTLWFRQAAGEKKPMNETLAVGNGRMGALIFGAPAKERISVNEDSLWTGDENPAGNYDKMGAYKVLGNVFVALPGHEQSGSYRR